MAKQKIQKLLLILACLFVLFSGCSSSDESAQTKSAKTDKSTQEKEMYVEKSDSTVAEFDEVTEDIGGIAGKNDGAVAASTVVLQRNLTDKHIAKAKSENWQYGTVKRRENQKEYKNWTMIVQQVQYDWNDDGKVVIKDWPDSEVEAKINQGITEHFEEFRRSTPVIQGLDVYKRKYPNYYVDNSVDIHGGINNLLSVTYVKYYRFLDENDNFANYLRYMDWQVYDLKTGELVSLRDLFYEDTDYVSLLNQKVAEWELLCEDFGENISFGGIQRDQKFCFDYSGNLCLQLDHFGNVMYIDSIDFAELSAMCGLIGEDYVPGYNERLFFGRNSSEELYVEEEIRPSYLGIEGLDEQVSLMKGSRVIPEEVLSAITINEKEKVNKYTKKMVTEWMSLADELEYSLKMDIFVDRIGPLYRVYFRQYFELESYGDDEFWEHYSEFQSKYSAKMEGKTLFLDENGKTCSYLDLFPKDVDFIQLYVEKMKESDKDLGYLQDDAYYEDLRRQLPNMNYDITSTELVFYPDSMESYYYLPWKYLYSYLK